jgi:uncharacterized protein
MRGRVLSSRTSAARFCLAILVALAAAPALAAKEETLPPKPTRYVTDRAGVLSGGRDEALNSRLEEFEKETSNQILVWTDRRVPESSTLEEFTVAAARKWEPGQKGKNNGAVLFVFVDDRKMRIEVGYGLEGVLPDAIAHRIQEEEILPRFRAGDYPGGIEAGVNAMIAATKGEYKGTGSTVASRSRRRGSRGIPGCAPFLFLLFFLFIPLMRLSRWRTYGRRGWWSGGGGWGGFGGFGGGGFGGGGGGGGGFSGGGGSFGGGGSSGSW